MKQQIGCIQQYKEGKISVSFGKIFNPKTLNLLGSNYKGLATVTRYKAEGQKNG